MPLEFRELARPGVVSIVIPCYNSARFLADTLESAFTQSYPHTEIIVIDDGSTDGTPELIRSYGDRVRAEFGPNRGASAARNRGTELARGEFIQYLDSDDLLTPDAIARRVAALQRSGADVAYSDWERLVEIEAERVRARPADCPSHRRRPPESSDRADNIILGTARSNHVPPVHSGEDRRLERMAADYSGCAVSSRCGACWWPIHIRSGHWWPISGTPWGKPVTTQ